jgi:transcriptional regulator with XRE-family HTH domain
MANSSTRKDNDRAEIARKVRALRIARGWTQAHLSRRLHLSQARLSEIERGDGSFTAEQFLLILKLFNVGVAHFVPQPAHDQNAALQNALAALGAGQLVERDDVLPTERLQDVSDVVRETLASAAPRLLTALGPVIVRHIDHINLKKLYGELVDVGLERRFGWVIDNILHAIRAEMAQPLARPWPQRYRRGEIVLELFQEFMSARLISALVEPFTPEILDPGIRTRKTLNEVKASSSAISRRWGLVSDLQPDDFTVALRAARVAD